MKQQIFTLNSVTCFGLIIISVASSSTLAEQLYPDRFSFGPTDQFPSTFTPFDVSDVVTSVLPNSGVLQVAEWTRSGAPGSTMVLTADGMLDDVSFDVYGEGQGVTPGVISKSLTNSCAVILSTNLPSDDLYLLWPKNEFGYGYPVPINKTEAWWADATVSVGATLNVYGRNLDLDEDDDRDDFCQLYINGAWVANSSVNPYRAQFTVPPLSDGEYTAYVHNGHGKKYGWSAPLTITIETVTAWDENINNWINVTHAPYNAVGDGVTDDRAAIMAAYAAVPAHGTLFFPEGTYAYASQIDFGATDKRVMGDGPILSILHGIGSSYENNRSIQWKATRCEINRMGFTGSTNFYGMQLFSNAGTDLALKNCTFDDSGVDFVESHLQNSVFMSNVHGFEIDKCKFITYKGVIFSACDDIVFTDCEFRGRGDTYCTYLLCLNGSDQVSITGCTGQPHDPSDYTKPNGWSQGRFIYMDGNSGGVENIYIADNETIDMAPRMNWDIDLYGGFDLGTQRVTKGSSSPNIVTVSALDELVDLQADEYNLLPGDSFQVIDGVGRSGRTYYVASVEKGTGEITIEGEWHELVGGPVKDSVTQLQSKQEKQPHQNAGEQILAEHQRTHWRGEVISATANTVTLASGADEWVEAGYHRVTVMSGKGFGQSRSIASMENDVAILTEDWNVIPDSNSIISAGAYNRRLVIYNNVLDGPSWMGLPVDYDNRTTPYSTNTSPIETASCGVSFYGAHVECIVANNLFREVGTAIANFGFVDDGRFDSSISVVMPNYFNLFKENHAENCRRALINTIGKSSSAPELNQPDIGIFAAVYQKNTYTNLSVTLWEGGEGHEMSIMQFVNDQNVLGIYQDEDEDEEDVSLFTFDTQNECRVEVYNEKGTYYHDAVAVDKTHFIVDYDTLPGEWSRIRFQEKDGTNWVTRHEEWRGSNPSVINTY
ncbi:MAG: glycosyl hydrolase family 28-related protein [Pontiella sp.]